MKILITGSAGFVGGYLVKELIDAGHHVVGIDNFSKYGPVSRAYDSHERYTFVEGDCKNPDLMRELIADCDQVVAGAAMIGGISYFHQFAYDLIAENERIIAATFDAAIEAFQNSRLKKINVLSSSMAFECTNVYPTPEGAEKTAPPPKSTYGFQKLAVEYFAKGALEQYGLPYTVIRPFNCVGIGEGRALTDVDVMSGNIKLAMSHVLPDLIQKTLKGQDPLHILGEGNQIRCYTHGADLVKGIRLCIEREEAINEDFNISTDSSTTVLELAELVWKTIHGDAKPFRYTSDKAFEHDVQKRIPDTSKAKRVLGFETDIDLEQSVQEVVEWIRTELAAGRI